MVDSPRDERFAAFSTEIDTVDFQKERLLIRGKDLCDLIGEGDFSSAIYHTLLNKSPSDVEKKLLNASLTSIHVGHQAIPPTIHAARVAASTRAEVSQCLAAGLCSSGKLHLGAIRQVMEQYISIEEWFDGGNVYDFTRNYVGAKLDGSEMLFGFGHPYMKKDPRPEALRDLVDKLGYVTDYIIMHDAIRDELYDRKGKSSNVDGINGAILLSLGFSPVHGEGLFLISRMIGALAHIDEEYKRPIWSAWGSLIARNNIPGLKEE